MSVKNENVVTAHWKENKNFIVESFVKYDYEESTSLTELLNNIFCAGPAYYYVVDFATHQIEYISPSVKNVLGLDPEHVRFEDIVGRVHPDDLSYIEIAEKFSLSKLKDLTPEQVAHTKLSYCFRERTAEGNYELFQLQALWINNAARAGSTKLVNIHTNISHLTVVNNYVMTLSSASDSDFFFRYDLKAQVKLQTKAKLYTRRELEIVRLIAAGLESEEIARKLFISVHTVKTHRKNILAKGGVNNVAQLISVCLSEGLL